MLCHFDGGVHRTSGLKSGGELPLLCDVDRYKQNHTLNAARVALVIAGSFVAANARDARTSIAVSATVLPVARLELQSAPTQLQISAQDLNRGFVDAPEATSFVVRSNCPTGFALDVVTLMPLASAVVVQGLESEQSVGADGGTLVQRWAMPRVVSLSLKFRLILAPGLTAGHYPWPLRLSVRPLDSL